MSIEQAYRKIDRALCERGGKAPVVVLWPAIRDGRSVLDFALPIGTPERAGVVEVIERCLGPARGRDRISAYTLQLARVPLEFDRRSAA